MRKKQRDVFLSYGRVDSRQAVALEKQLNKRGISTWRDVPDVDAGVDWWKAIEEGLLAARAIVVLISKNSVHSDWVTFECGLARGTKKPMVAVTIGRETTPRPMQRFQSVSYSPSKVGAVADKIKVGIHVQRRLLLQDQSTKKPAATPKMLARFVETNGELAGSHETPRPSHVLQLSSLAMELWLEGVPDATNTVRFEILDEGVRDNIWTVRRSKGEIRAFLTDDICLYGDVEIWARGAGKKGGEWSITTTLYEALDRYYRSRKPSAEIQKGLKQIRDN